MHVLYEYVCVMCVKKKKRLHLDGRVFCMRWRLCVMYMCVLCVLKKRLYLDGRADGGLHVVALRLRRVENLHLERSAGNAL